MGAAFSHSLYRRLGGEKRKHGPKKPGRHLLAAGLKPRHNKKGQEKASGRRRKTAGRPELQGQSLGNRYVICSFATRDTRRRLL